jgi:hypothetical protein
MVHMSVGVSLALPVCGLLQSAFTFCRHASARAKSYNSQDSDLTDQIHLFTLLSPYNSDFTPDLREKQNPGADLRQRAKYLVGIL